MANKKSEKATEARKLYDGGMKLIDIADKLNVPSGTVRRWKCEQNWGEQQSERSGLESEHNTERSDNAISWVDMEHEYVTDIRKKPCTLEELAIKYSVSIGTVEKQSMDNKWTEKRRKYKETIKQKAIERSSDEDADRIVNLLRIADMASEKAEQAIGELETYLVHNKTKTKVVEYKDNTAIGKPTKEVIQEDETIEKMNGPVDRLGLSQVTAALKNIKEIYSLPVDLEDKKYKTEYDKKRAEVSDNSGEEILKNMKAIADILQNPVSNRKIEDYE